jgi:hypothetical protein
MLQDEPSACQSARQTSSSVISYPWRAGDPSRDPGRCALVVDRERTTTTAGRSDNWGPHITSARGLSQRGCAVSRQRSRRCGPRSECGCGPHVEHRTAAHNRDLFDEINGSVAERPVRLWFAPCAPAIGGPPRYPLVFPAGISSAAVATGRGSRTERRRQSDVGNCPAGHRVPRYRSRPLRTHRRVRRMLAHQSTSRVDTHVQILLCISRRRRDVLGTRP